MTTKITTARRITLASATTALALGTLMGCTPDKPTVSSGSPPASQSQQAPAPAPAPAKKDANVAAFGDTVTYKSGLAITVAAPEAFAPSAGAPGVDQPLDYIFAVTVTNGSAERFEPAMLSVKASSMFPTPTTSVPGSPIFDSQQDINGSIGSPTIAQGAAMTFKFAFSVMSDVITVEVQASFTDPAAIFESNK